MSIPKVLFQTSKNKPEQYVIDKITSKLNDWKYIHFNDEEIIKFFNENYIEEFKDIIKVFNSFKNGAHKADLFRYYYIFINGGVFMDSDAMLEVNIEDVTKDYTFFSVNSICTPKTIFQGFIGAIPNHTIIYKALVDIYNIDINKLSKDYFLVVRNLYNIINSDTYDSKMKLYTENFIDKGRAICYNENNEILLTHYHEFKVIPC